jgi:hypothetical protein
VEALAIGVLVPAALSVLLLAVLALQHVWLGATERRRAELEVRLRPIALAVVDEGRMPGALTPRAASDARLLGLVDHPDPVERSTAVELVGLLGDATDGRRLVERLIDTSADVRAHAALALDELSFRRHPRGWEVARLVAYSVAENFGYRQLNDLWRALAFVDLARRRHEWGEQRRRGIGRAVA